MAMTAATDGRDSAPDEAVATAEQSRDVLGNYLCCTVTASIWLMAGCRCALGGVSAAESVRHIPATAIVRFAGTSTLHDFSGQLPAQPFSLIL